MHGKIPRFFRLLLLTITFSAVPLNLWAEIKVYPEKPIFGEDAKFVIEAARKTGSKVIWTVEPLGYVQSAVAPQPEVAPPLEVAPPPAEVPPVEVPPGAPAPDDSQAILPQQTPKVSHFFEKEGRYLITATVIQGEDLEKTYSTEVIVLGEPETVSEVNEKGETPEANEAGDSSGDVSPAGTIKDVLVKEANATSKLKFTEFVVNLLLSDKTVVDELDQEFLQSCNALSQVFKNLADEAPQGNPFHGTSDNTEVARFMDNTYNQIKQKLDEIHPDWKTYRESNDGEISRGEDAWNAFLEKFETLLNNLEDEADDNFKRDFTFKEAWQEIGKGFALAGKTKEEFFTKYKTILDNYNREYGGSLGPRKYRGPRCPLLIRLGFY